MTIPKNISRNHLLIAIKDIDSREVFIPEKRQSTKYSIFYNEKFYPPKFVICQANKYANGYFYNSDLFNGGRESNEFLKKRGFQIIDTPTKN